MSEPMFSRLKDIAALGNGINDSMTSLCSEAEREELAMTFTGPLRQASTLSTASMASLSTSASKKKKKKAALWAEKYETTAVVFGPLTTHEDFKELVMQIKTNVGEIKSHYYREEQFCGFVYFHVEDLADDCKHRYSGTMFKGNTIKACSPSQFFKNEEDAFPDPARQPRRQLSSQMSSLSVSSMAPGGAPEPSATLVIKNLCFGLKQEKLLDFMASLKVPPQSVSYHYDSNGLFRGVAFAKYHSADSAAESLKELEGAELGGRKLRVEFKRRTNGVMSSPLRQMSFDASQLSPIRPRHSSVPQVPNLSPGGLLSPGVAPPPLALVNPTFNRSAPGAVTSSPSKPTPNASPSRVGSNALLATPPDFPVTPIRGPPAADRPAAESPVVLRDGMEFQELPALPPTDVTVRPPPAVLELKFDDPLKRPILRAGMEFA